MNKVEYGKLRTDSFSPSKDVWFSGWVYLAPQFKLPQTNISYNGLNCSLGVHIWRLSDALNAKKVSMDFNIPTAMDSIQLLFYQLDGTGNLSKTFVKWTSFQPASQNLVGQWHLWQIHINLGSPGKSDGFMRFYADNQFVDSMENQQFLPISADDTWAFSSADIQSNISDGGNTNCAGAWPAQNGWYVDDVRICSNESC